MTFAKDWVGNKPALLGLKCHALNLMDTLGIDEVFLTKKTVKSVFAVQ